ncbi:hypothetical protein PoB_001628000 [Plakobranchus ocellatus]|uniref:Uncharacterized protein n=1 Tax=Plakobranchus ocellatus TaxID=259542 RepID=A0AAV3Z3P1_9GAST|nr:hypothetical protein PoB_001628000 [Plakobranchus ocellatus]
MAAVLAFGADSYHLIRGSQRSVCTAPTSIKSGETDTFSVHLPVFLDVFDNRMPEDRLSCRKTIVEQLLLQTKHRDQESIGTKTAKFFTKTLTAVAASHSEQLQGHKNTQGTNNNRDNIASTTGIINIGDHSNSNSSYSINYRMRCLFSYSTISLINLTSTATSAPIPADTFAKHKLLQHQQQQ